MRAKISSQRNFTAVSAFICVCKCYCQLLCYNCTSVSSSSFFFLLMIIIIPFQWCKEKLMGWSVTLYDCDCVYDTVYVYIERDRDQSWKLGHCNFFRHSCWALQIGTDEFKELGLFFLAFLCLFQLEMGGECHDLHVDYKLLVEG